MGLPQKTIENNTEWREKKRKKRIISGTFHEVCSYWKLVIFLDILTALSNQQSFFGLIIQDIFLIQLKSETYDAELQQVDGIFSIEGYISENLIYIHI